MPAVGVAHISAVGRGAALTTACMAVAHHTRQPSAVRCDHSLFVVPAGRLHTTELAQWVKRQKEWQRERKRRLKMADKQATRTDPALLLQGIHSSRPQPRSQLAWADHDYLEDLQGKRLAFVHRDAPVTASARGLAAERLTATHVTCTQLVAHRSLLSGTLGT